jgi:uncharacterized RDD family membrane protein YckC
MMTPTNNGDVIMRRVIASLVDTYALMMVVVLVFWLTRPMDKETNSQAAITFLFVLPVYHLLADYFWGGSLGKHMLKLRVISGNGGSVSARQAAIRALLLVPEIFMSLLSLYLIATEHRNRRIGDIIAGTTVRKSVTSRAQ